MKAFNSSSKKNLTLTILIVGVGLLIDQLSKQLAIYFLNDETLMWGTFGFHLIQNNGFLRGLANWDVLSSAKAYVIGLGLSFSLTAILISWELRHSWRAAQVGLLLLSTGVLGNLTDRLIRWGVVDFIRFSPPASSHILICNLADLMQWMGLVFVLYSIFKFSWRVVNNSERRVGDAAGFVNGQRAWRITVFGCVICLLGSQLAGTLFIYQEMPGIMSSWLVLVATFDFPIFYLIYRVAQRVAKLANGPLYATLRGLEHPEGKLNFRQGEEVPELEKAFADKIRQSS